MLRSLPILLAAGFIVAVMVGIGRMLLRALGIRLYRQEEDPLAFVIGAACLSLLTFVLCAIGLARKNVFLLAGLAILSIAVRRGAHRPTGERFAPLPAFWKWLFGSIFAVYCVVYFFNAMAPETSPDGSTYHLGIVSRYLREHAFVRLPTSIYANLSQGIELLYLPAFAFGRHSAAALLHFAFLVTLTLLILSYARRFGFPGAGVCAALLVFVSPIVGVDGTSAYNDVATAAIIFTGFYLAWIWASDPSSGALLGPLGLVAGFAYAAKYTAFLLVPYVLAVVAWKSFRRGVPIVKPLLITAGCAALMIAPWMIKNAVWFQNPVSPFFNSLFPNPDVHISFEKEYGFMMRHYQGLKSDWEIPLELTVRGGVLGGLLGPVFLLAPLGLIAALWPSGRRLLLAALIFGLPYMANIGTRFLIPTLPFVALCMGLALAQSRFVVAALLIAHAVLSWPKILPKYVASNAWRLIRPVPIRQALRFQREEDYLNFTMPHWATARMIDKLVPAGAKVFTFNGAAEAYTSHEMVVGFQSAYGERIRDIIWTPLIPELEPTWLLRFRYPAQPLRQIRVVQMATAAPPDMWSIAEFRIFRGTDELPRAADWKLRAKPNPWDVQLAFDNSPVTRWRSWDFLHPGMSVAVEFPALQITDSVLLECSHDQYTIQIKLEGMDDTGKWKTLAEKPEESHAKPMIGLRRVAAEEIKARGVSYLLVYDFDYGSDDFMKYARAWGATEIGEHNGARLYRLD
jgi:hypothetical protein